MVTVEREMVDALTVLVQEIGHDGRARDRFHDLPDDRVELGETHFQREFAGSAAVGLVGGVGRVEGIDFPGPDSKGPEIGHGPVVVVGYDAYFYDVAEEALVMELLVGGVGCCVDH